MDERIGGETGQRRQNPVRIERHTTESGKRGWRWTCADHARHRGMHWDVRWSDAWRERHGKPPAMHPWERALRGAVEHWHKLHAPPHACCHSPSNEVAGCPGETSANANNYRRSVTT